MHKLCLLPIHDKATGQLLLVAAHHTGTGVTSLLDCYLKGSGLTLYQVHQQEDKVRRLLTMAAERDLPVLTTNFKGLLHALRIPASPDRWNVYDLQLTTPNPASPNFRMLCTRLVQGMGQVEPVESHRTLANAAVVYQEWENRGILRGGIKQQISWFQDTATGRSRVNGFNIQGIPHSTTEHIGNPLGTERDVLLLFDWISADIRIAAHLSGDQRLEQAFLHSDPYMVIMGHLGLGDRPEDRQQCKQALLQAINSMDIGSVVFEVYPQLGRWIRRCWDVTESGGSLHTLLGRRFSMRGDATRRQVLNGCMQGSVAEAMQLAIRRIWEVLGYRLLAEIHDSLVISCEGRATTIRAVIDQVQEILLYPFRELAQAGVCADLDLPFKVSVGQVWHGWRELETHRAGGVSRPGQANIPEQMSTDRSARDQVNQWFPLAVNNGDAAG